MMMSSSLAVVVHDEDDVVVVDDYELCVQTSVSTTRRYGLPFMDFDFFDVVPFLHHKDSHADPNCIRFES